MEKPDPQILALAASEPLASGARVCETLCADSLYQRTAHHRYTLANQRFIEKSGFLVKRVDSVELYRIKELSIQGTLLLPILCRIPMRSYR